MPDIDVVIVGYGSAGKRHELAARERHLSVVTVDPDHTKKALMFDYAHAFRVFKPQMVVVATPPNRHLEVIEAALEFTPYILCEKPLCDFGQIEDAQRIIDEYQNEKVNVAYNYRYHRSVTDILFSGELAFDSYSLYGCQYRAAKPAWGYLLDHVSHDVDIMRMFAGDYLTVDDARHMINRDAESWKITGRGSGGVSFSIEDVVTNRPSNRVAGVSCASQDSKRGLFVELDADKMMYEIMWDRFIASADGETDIDISMSDALITQRILENIFEGSFNE